MYSSDRQLVRRLKANERAAFEEVVERHYQPIYRHLWHLCGEAETAADLTQETFVQAWRSLPTFEGRSAFGTWLGAIAVRVWCRSLQQRGTPAPVPLDELAETLVDPTHGPSELYEAHALQDQVLDALHQLPPEYREALVLFYIQVFARWPAASTVMSSQCWCTRHPAIGRAERPSCSRS
jgi:RNA polymerase sigma-70 factor (ECF subfamily)